MPVSAAAMRVLGLARLVGQVKTMVNELANTTVFNAAK
ncbi:MAG: hypothetical protein JWP29_140 [Rhodoferax sp.]|nr:hypothetical protein [Rhodoferax sp.]